ncbi:ULP-PROTEASE domain-containing protein [Mycena chlorophos]|uniref:ULP-PROTEASE domain-containing protein n=1 Tax=Mycena chlorophos TaxID=658473 RepID=A0A8H6RX00_MYCCL|nr:ULP-PROTEASE domain-containing protein [Mycena chlorophos]
MITCLPPELIDGIVSHLSDTQTLQSCCLAAWLFRDPCQRRLFHAMTLSRDGWDGQTFPQAQRLFDGRREIAKYVLVLRLLLPTANVNHLGYGQWQSPPESQSSDGATTFVPAALNVLAALDNVRYLEISTGTLPVSWRELPAEFASANVDLVRQCRGTLQKLVLRNIYELPRAKSPHRAMPNPPLPRPRLLLPSDSRSTFPLATRTSPRPNVDPRALLPDYGDDLQPASSFRNRRRRPVMFCQLTKSIDGKLGPVDTGSHPRPERQYRLIARYSSTIVELLPAATGDLAGRRPAVRSRGGNDEASEDEQEAEEYGDGLRGVHIRLLGM